MSIDPIGRKLKSESRVVTTDVAGLTQPFIILVCDTDSAVISFNEGCIKFRRVNMAKRFALPRAFVHHEFSSIELEAE